MKSDIVNTTMIYLKRDESYLLLYRNKKQNDINHNKWIGIGGHLEKDESKEQALVREIKEETGLDVLHYVYRGELLFVNNDFSEIMYLFTSDDFAGNLIECDEGELKFIDKDKIMDLNLWEGDKAFLPLLINTNEFIKMKLIYENDVLKEVVREE